VQLALARCGETGGWLFRVLPDLFPHKRLTPIEAALWGRYYQEREERRKKNRNKKRI